MTMPYRYYNLFRIRTLRGKDVGNSFLTIDKWTNDHLEVAEIGKIKNYSLGDNVWNTWRMMYRPINAPDFKSFDGLDEIALIKTAVSISPPFYNVGSLTKVYVVNGIPSDANEWLLASITGKYYNGVNPWGAYPQAVDYCLSYSTIEHTIADLPKDTYIYEGAYNFGISVFANQKQDNFWRNGICLYYGSATPSEGGWNADDGFRMNIVPRNMMVKYFNAVCNSLSRYSMTTAGGVEVKLYGLGFQNDEDEIEEGGAGKPGSWGDSVHIIYFEGLQGQGDYTFRVNPAIEPNYDIDSNVQITIDGMPAMAAGTYQIKMRKSISYHGTGKDIDSYAGDWRCDPDGRVHSGSRIIFEVFEEEEEPEEPVIFIKWKWKSRDGEIFKYYAPIDSRTPDIFFEGKILKVGAFNRSVDDLTGMVQMADVDIELSNTDQEFSILLAEYTCYHQPVEIFWGYRNQPFGWRRYICTMIVEDFEAPASTFKAKLRDITSLYF